MKPILRAFELPVSTEQYRDQKWNMEEQLPVVNRIRPLIGEVDVLMRVRRGDNLSSANWYFRLPLASEIVRGNVAANRTD